MKASELVQQLQKVIDEHGDHDICKIIEPEGEVRTHELFVLEIYDVDDQGNETDKIIGIGVFE